MRFNCNDPTRVSHNGKLKLKNAETYTTNVNNIK